MNLRKYNQTQVQEAKDNYDTEENRYRFFLQTGDKYPSIRELQDFYLVDNSRRFADRQKQLELDFGENQEKQNN